MNHTASTILDDNSGERMVPENTDMSTFWEHVYRYAFALHFVKGKRVLDIACGEGYGGAAFQKAGASHVIGIDISESVCLHARNKYGLDTRQGTAEQIPLPDGSIDIIVSFETIEHVPNPNRFLDECLRILAPGGRLVISTPDKDIYGRKVQNPYHCSEMTAGEFTEALSARFLHPRFYTQRPHSAAWWSTRTIVCENPPWGFIRGARRLRRAVQRWIYPEVVKDPSDEQRSATVDTILKVAESRRRPLNPYLLRPRGRWDGERSVYIIATAVR